MSMTWVVEQMIWKSVSSFLYSHHIFTAWTIFLATQAHICWCYWYCFIDTRTFHFIYLYQGVSLVVANITLKRQSKVVVYQSTNSKACLPLYMPHHPFHGCALFSSSPTLSSSSLTHLLLINPSWHRCWQHLRQKPERNHMTKAYPKTALKGLGPSIPSPTPLSFLSNIHRTPNSFCAPPYDANSPHFAFTFQHPSTHP